MMSVRRRLLAFICSLLFLSTPVQMQATGFPPKNKPYKVIASGKQITIKGNKNIRQVMVWTVNGNRIAEHHDINASSYAFQLPVAAKSYFLMVNMGDGKVYTEKIGAR